MLRQAGGLFYYFYRKISSKALSINPEALCGDRLKIKESFRKIVLFDEPIAMGEEFTIFR